MKFKKILPWAKWLRRIFKHISVSNMKMWKKSRLYSPYFTNLWKKYTPDCLFGYPTLHLSTVCCCQACLWMNYSTWEIKTYKDNIGGNHEILSDQLPYYILNNLPWIITYKISKIFFYRKEKNIIEKWPGSYFPNKNTVWKYIKDK